MLGDLGKRDVPIIGIHQGENERLMCVQLRDLWLALPTGLKAAALTPGAIPRTRRRNPDRKPPRRFPGRKASFYRLDNPLSQIHAIGPCHPAAPFPNHRDQGISTSQSTQTIDSDYGKTALAFDQLVRTCQLPVTFKMQTQRVLQLAQCAVLAKPRATDDKGGALVACVEGNSRDGKA